MKYCVVIEETLVREVVVEANSFDEATNIVANAYHNEDIVLDGDDFHNVQYGTHSYTDEEVQEMELSDIK
jgi:hypothetical protein